MKRLPEAREDLCVKSQEWKRWLRKCKEKKKENLGLEPEEIHGKILGKVQKILGKRGRRKTLGVSGDLIQDKIMRETPYIFNKRLNKMRTEVHSKTQTVVSGTSFSEAESRWHATSDEGKVSDCWVNVGPGLSQLREACGDIVELSLHCRQ